MEKIRRLRVQREQPAAHGKARLILRAHLLFLDPNPRPFRQLLRRRQELQILVHHHKAEDASARPTPKALKDLPMRIDREGRRFLDVKRAICLVNSSPALQRKIPANYIDDVIRRGDLFDEGFGKSGHGRSEAVAATPRKRGWRIFEGFV